MSDVDFPTTDHEAKATLDATAHEFADALLEALGTAQCIFKANPTKRTFQQWVTAKACYGVAARFVYGDDSAPEGSK